MQKLKLHLCWQLHHFLKKIVNSWNGLLIELSLKGHRTGKFGIWQYKAKTTKKCWLVECCISGVYIYSIYITFTQCSSLLQNERINVQHKACMKLILFRGILQVSQRNPLDLMEYCCRNTRCTCRISSEARREQGNWQFCKAIVMRILWDETMLDIEVPAEYGNSSVHI